MTDNRLIYFVYKKLTQLDKILCFYSLGAHFQHPSDLEEIPLWTGCHACPLAKGGRPCDLNTASHMLSLSHFEDETEAHRIHSRLFTDAVHRIQRPEDSWSHNHGASSHGANHRPVTVGAVTT